MGGLRGALGRSCLLLAVAFGLSAFVLGACGPSSARNDVGLDPPGAVPDAGTSDAGVDAPPRADAGLDASETPPLRVLFIGNSYTFVNDLPGMTAALVGSAGRGIAVDSVTVGGASLEALWNAGDAQKKIEAGTFTHVVLQGQSLEACFDTATYQYYAEQFATLARAKGAAVLLYGTWPREDGDPFYASLHTEWGPEELEACLDSSFIATAVATGSTLVDVGRTWMALHHLNPALPLYQPDHSHATPQGTFVAACKFFEALVGAAPLGLPHPSSVTDAEATFIASNIDAPSLDGGVRDADLDGD